MANIEQCVKTSSAPGPILECSLLAEFETHELGSVRAAFAAAAPVHLGQGWLAKLEPDFAPGTVRTGWWKDSLLVFAELTDQDVFSEATGNNQPMWKLGDTFEIFLRQHGRVEYFEFHVTPNNFRLQLCIRNPEALQRARTTNSIEECLLPDNVFHSRTWLAPETQKWFVLASIPARVLAGQAEFSPGSHWDFSFSRYDQTRGRVEPMISSTSPHPVADFHRQQEWGKLTLVAGS